MYQSPNIEWTGITNTYNLNLPLSDCITQLKYPIPAEFGSGWCEGLEVQPGMLLYRLIHSFHVCGPRGMIPFMKFNYEPNEPTLLIESTVGSPISHQDIYPQIYLPYQEDCSIYRYSSQFCTEQIVDTFTDSESIFLCIRSSLLKKLLGDQDAENLLQHFNLKEEPSARLTPIPKHISAILHSSFSPTYSGSTQKIFAQARILQYLCALTTLASSQAAKTPRQKYTEIMHVLEREVIDHEGRIPNIISISSKYGISPITLNACFIERYGKSFHAYFTERRLNEARHALIKTDIPIKVVASKLGYSHVNHFINAFKKKFGIPPGNLRREWRASQSAVATGSITQ